MYIPPPPSPEARELGGHLTDIINAYQADHPYMSPLEVRQAMKLAQHAAPGGHKLTVRVVLIGVIVVLGAAILAFLRVAQPG